MTPACAEEMAPSVVRELRFTGVALSQECKDAVNKVQEDKANMKQVRKCEKTEGVGKGIMGALNNDDLDGAVLAAEVGLEKCMNISKECSFQVAPVLINQFLTMYSMNTGGMMPVLVRTLNTTIDAAEIKTIINGSLLHLPTDESLLTWVPQAEDAKKSLSAVSLRGSAAAAPQPVAHLNSRGGKAPAGKALKVKKQPDLTAECQEQFVALRQPEQQRAAAKCEEDNKMPTKVIDHLQKAQKAEAEAVTKQ